MSRERNSRTPRAFDIDEPGVEIDAPQSRDPSGKAAAATGAKAAGEPSVEATIHRPIGEIVQGGVRWGSLFLAAMFGLASLALTVWFARFVSVAVVRDDWIGWVSLGLVCLMALAGLVMAAKEAAGFWRLGRLGDLRQRVEALRSAPDRKAERKLVGDIAALVTRRDDMRWASARMEDHRAAVLDPGQLLEIADRELLAPLDGRARALIARSAKRTSIVTALSPAALITVGFVAYETLKLLRQLAENYGARPGLIGGLRLMRMALVNLLASGGVALTDDLLGQFLGQDLLRRLSRRLGEGVFNAALTARIGVAAVEVVRPMPFIVAPPVRARDFLAELVRRGGAAKPGEGSGPTK